MTETATPAAEPDYDPVLIERLAAAIEGERVADGSWATLELPEARDIVRLVLDALPWPKPDQGSAIAVAHADGPTSIEWGTHRTAIIVQPDVLEGWVAQMDEVRRERARAVAEVAEAEAEVERLRGIIAFEESQRPKLRPPICVAAHNSPDCSAGKCGGCTGDAWCDTHDDHAPCACACHRDAPGATATGGDAS